MECVFGTADDGLVFHGVSFRPSDRTIRTFSAETMAGELDDPEVFCWIDMQAADIGTLNLVLHYLDIDLVLVNHFDVPEVLPRIVEREDCLAFYLYEIEDPELHLDTSHGLSQIRFHRMILVLGEDFVITYHKHQLDAVDHVKDTCAASFRLAGRTPGFIAFLFLQRCLYDYAHLNLANDNYLDLLDAESRANDTRQLAEEINISGRNILILKKLSASLHIVLMLLATKRSPFVSPEAQSSFQEMMQNAHAIREAVDSSRDLLNGILASIQAAAANRTSEVARILTIVSGVMLPLSLVAGIYGMNFVDIPGLATTYGFYVTLGAMGAITTVLMLLFYRLGWIGTRRDAKSSLRNRSDSADTDGH
ncbi:MAG: hypothetical protein KDH88_14220 [Chromatiales bacterium]|nr:hypothetical protein [Chromatiales bacterium]